MKVITITNRKGGVGKSTMASHIAAGLAIRGYRVGLVDTDSQGSGSMMLNMRKEDGLFNLLVEKYPLERVVRAVPFENFGTVDTTGEIFIIPSSDRTHQIPYLLDEHESFLFLESMQAFGERYNLDYILVDTNPSLSLFDSSIYLASDAFIYVTECELLSIEGIHSAYDQMRTFGIQRKRYLNRPESRLLGIVPNKYRTNTIIHQENLKTLRQNFGSLVWEPVVLRTLWTEASTVRQLVYILDPNSEAANDANTIVDSVEQGLVAWQTDER